MIFKILKIMSILNRYRMVLAITTICCVRAIMVQAQNSNSTCIVKVSNPGAIVAPICRGQQVEEFNHQFEGGLYAQLINNPSFEEWNNPIANWAMVKTGSSEGTISPRTSFETGLLNRFILPRPE
jgi:alpha-N-arabinofuranosidase